MAIAAAPVGGVQGPATIRAAAASVDAWWRPTIPAPVANGGARHARHARRGARRHGPAIGVEGGERRQRRPARRRPAAVRVKASQPAIGVHAWRRPAVGVQPVGWRAGPTQVRVHAGRGPPIGRDQVSHEAAVVPAPAANNDTATDAVHAGVPRAGVAAICRAVRWRLWQRLGVAAKAAAADTVLAARVAAIDAHVGPRRAGIGGHVGRRRRPPVSTVLRVLLLLRQRVLLMLWLLLLLLLLLGRQPSILRRPVIGWRRPARVARHTRRAPSAPIPAPRWDVRRPPREAPIRIGRVPPPPPIRRHRCR